MIQRLFEFATDEGKSRIQIKLIDKLSSMINDEYGNYVVQHIVERRRTDNQCVFSILSKKVVDLCMGKHSR